MQSEPVTDVFTVNYTRRRYGRKTFTFAEVTHKDGRRIECAADPWPGVVWPRSALIWAIRSAGENLEPNRTDIKWARKMAKDGRTFEISPADRRQYIGEVFP